jgi:uridine kinase
MKTTKIIGIGGGSASGKTTIAKKLAVLCGGKSEGARTITARVVSMDNFYRTLRDDEDGDKFNWDAASAYDVKALINCIHIWKRGLGASIPRHDFSSYRSVPDAEYVDAADVIIIEGIHALSIETLLPLYDFKIFVECDHDEALARRIIRDTEERGYTLDLVLKRYFEFVKPALVNVIQPSKKNADCILMNNNGESSKMLSIIASAEL